MQWTAHHLGYINLNLKFKYFEEFFYIHLLIVKID